MDTPTDERREHTHLMIMLKRWVPPLLHYANGKKEKKSVEKTKLKKDLS